MLIQNSITQAIAIDNDRQKHTITNHAKTRTNAHTCSMSTSNKTDQGSSWGVHGVEDIVVWASTGVRPALPGVAGGGTGADHGQFARVSAGRNRVAAARENGREGAAPRVGAVAGPVDHKVAAVVAAVVAALRVGARALAVLVVLALVAGNALVVTAQLKTIIAPVAIVVVDAFTLFVVHKLRNTKICVDLFLSVAAAALVAPRPALVVCKRCAVDDPSAPALKMGSARVVPCAPRSRATAQPAAGGA